MSSDQMSVAPVIEVEGLAKSYGATRAVDGLSFQVHAGEIFGVVGPNGAGKTTTLECVEGVRRPDRGSIRVLGLEPVRDRLRLRERIGIQLQGSTLQDNLRVREALDLYASFYPAPADVVELIDQLGLAESARTPFQQLSGGQQQRLSLGLALIGDPEVVFLDELSTGLDPQGRRAIWELVRTVRSRGRTIVLSSHLMEEAERLCDRVAIIHRGRRIALDTPAALVASLDLDQQISVDHQTDRPFPELGALSCVRRVDVRDGRVTIVGSGSEFVGEVTALLAQRGVALENLCVERPSLEDAFLTLTAGQGHDRGD